MRIPKTIESRPVATGGEPREAFVEGLDEPDDERPEDGAGQVADAAEHGGRERDQPELEAGVVAHVELEQVDDPGRACERPGEQERDGDRPVDVDPHHRGGLGVLSHGPHRLPLLRRADEPREHDQERDHDHQHGGLAPRVRHVADVDRVRARDEVRHGAVVDAVDGEADVLDDERHPDGRDQRCQPWGVAERPVGDALDRGVEQGEHHHDHDERDRETDDDDRDARIVVEPEHAQDQGARDEPREREDVAVGEVDQLQDAVDERVAERHDAEDHPVREADQSDVDELARGLDEVDGEPEDHEPDEREPDQVGDAGRAQLGESGHRLATLNT